MSQPTGYTPSPTDYSEPTLDGVAFLRQCEPSEFGLPEGYVDPTMYHGTTPPMDEPQIGISSG